MNEQAEFEQIRAAIMAAGNIVGDAMEKLPGRNWDFLVVAVPSGQSNARIAMSSSVMPEQLPHFIKFIEVAYRKSAEKGSIIDDRKPEGPAS